MTGVVESGPLWRIASTRMPTRWGMFDTVGLERDVCEALQASRRLVKRPFRDQSAAMEAKNQWRSVRVRSDEAREALAAFLEKHRLPAEAVR